MILLSWGANSHGQLGQNIINEQIEKVTPVPDGVWNEIKLIACGGGHTLMLDHGSNLYSCGWNHKLQLGLENESSQFERVWPLSGIKFITVCCGWDFSCGVTNDQFMFVWGSNSHGQLGLPRQHFKDKIKPIRLHVNARFVSMGLRHTAIINSNNNVWITGCGKHGQLGLGEDILLSDRFEQVPVSNITHIACGQNHTLAWCSGENALYVWGDNKYGQLILSPDKYYKVYSPQKIDIGVKTPVKKLLSGWTNALLWLENGKILAWGRNNYGQLGMEGTFSKVVTIILPGNRQVKDIAIGSEHTICLAEDNTLWSWGWNEHANTGTGSGDIVLTPTLVEINPNMKIVEIFAGGGHNFITAESSKETTKSQIEDDSDNNTSLLGNNNSDNTINK